MPSHQVAWALLAGERARAALDAAALRLERSRLATVEEWEGPQRRAYDDAAARVRGAIADIEGALAVLHRRLLDAQETLRTADRLTRGAC
jgi:hypothetical protein